MAGEVFGRIGRGMLVLLGVTAGDGDEDARKLAPLVDAIARRYFPAEEKL